MVSLVVCCEGSDSFAHLGREEYCVIQVYRNTNRRGKARIKVKRRENLRIGGWVLDNLTCVVGLKSDWVMILKHTSIMLTKNKQK